MKKKSFYAKIISYEHIYKRRGELVQWSVHWLVLPSIHLYSIQPKGVCVGLLGLVVFKAKKSSHVGGQGKG